MHTIGSRRWDSEDFEPRRNVRYIAHWFARWSSMDTSLEPSERRMQTFWACLSNTSSIFGDVFEHGVWRRIMNHEHAELYGKSSILTVVKVGRIRWMGIWWACRTHAPPRRCSTPSPCLARGASVHSKLDGWIRFSETCWISVVYKDGEAADRDQASRRMIVDRAMSYQRVLSWAGLQESEKERERER